MKRTLLIDIDMLIFLYGLAKDSSAAAEFPDDMTCGGLFITSEDTQLSFEKAQVAILEKIGYLMQDLGATSWKYSMGSVSSFRKDSMDRYKAHRKPRPEVVVRLSEWFDDKFHEHHGLPITPGFEADDIIGMAQKSDGSTVVISGDKDFLQIPGYLYDIRKQSLSKITEAMADSFLLYQVLAGDNADGYLGCPGIGETKAHSLLLRAWETLGHDMDSLWDVVKFTYLSQGASTADFILNAQMAHIHRPCDKGLRGPWAPPNAMKTLKPSYIKLLKEITHACPNPIPADNTSA